MSNQIKNKDYKNYPIKIIIIITIIYDNNIYVKKDNNKK